MTTLDDGRHRMYVDVKPLPKLSERSYSTTDILRGVGSPGKSLPSSPPPPPQSSSRLSSPLLDNYINISKADAMLLFTSGTTSTSGTAKAVWLSHVSLHPVVGTYYADYARSSSSWHHSHHSTHVLIPR